MAGEARGARQGRSTTARGRARPAHSPPRSSQAREIASTDVKLGSSVAFTHQGEAAAWSPIRARPGPLLSALIVTVLWFVTNVRHLSLLDVLPFAWTWLTLWLVLSVALELWRRHVQPPRPPQRRQ